MFELCKIKLKIKKPPPPRGVLSNTTKGRGSTTREIQLRVGCEVWVGMGLPAHYDEVEGLVPKQDAALDLSVLRSPSDTKPPLEKLGSRRLHGQKHTIKTAILEA